jgi:maleylpyruvate isomerase
MKLYGYWRSSCTNRVRIALHYKGVEHEYIPVNLSPTEGAQNRPEFKERNPFAQVPVLEVPHAGAPLYLSQSMAILEYLEETIESRPLLPSDATLRARVRQYAELINSGIQPLQNISVLAEVAKRTGSGELEWLQHFISKGLRALEHSVRQTAGRYCVGDQVTFADVCLVPQLYAARRFEVDLTPMPSLQRVESECMKLDAFERSRPEHQLDAPKP